MKLSKKIPARTKTIKINWCTKDWVVMSQKYRDIRNKYHNKKFGFYCDWCRHEFENGESMSIAQPVKGKNMILCSRCADDVLSSV